MTSFPRASGDGPSKWQKRSNAAKFPPRERGWSLEGSARLAGACVSPARAGMVPTQQLDELVKRRFPRASGDGPRPSEPVTGNNSFPPRERGWSVRMSCGQDDWFVSPARAGMVPRKADAACTDPCFPRASGDGPRKRRQPKTPSKFPPRERGWSRWGARRPLRSAVSPARAGMVPRKHRQ